MTDLRQTKEYGKYMKALGWQVLQCQMSNVKVQIFLKKIPLIGNIAKLQRPEGKLEPQALGEFAKKHKLAAFYIEPTSHESLVTSHDFVPAKSCFLPSKTIHLDLLQSNKVLFSQMDKDTRYAIRLAQKRGVIVKETRDIEAFTNLWHKSARSRGMWLPQTKEIRALWTAFGPLRREASSKTHILLVYSAVMHVHTSTVLAGVLIVRTPAVTYYMYAASTKEGNKLSAPSLLVWEAIKLAKRKGCKIFDFEGIYDDCYPQTKSWQGFTKFKEGFGGKTVTFPKTFVQYYNPILKLVRV